MEGGREGGRGERRRKDKRSGEMERNGRKPRERGMRTGGEGAGEEEGWNGVCRNTILG